MQRWRRCGLLSLIGLSIAGSQLGSMRAEARSLSLREAVALATSGEGNPEVQLAGETVAASRARAAEVRAGLLPQVDGSLMQRRQTINLEAQGLYFAREFLPSPLIGPFSTFDARGEVSQTLFNWSLLERYRSAREAIQSAELAGQNTKNSVAAATAAAYLTVLRDQARLEAANANRRLAQELLALARHQKEAGTGIAVEVTRAEVKVSQQEQACLAAEEAHSSSMLRLKRWLGMNLADDLLLTGSLEAPAEREVLDDQTALARAMERRSDLQAQRSRIEAAQRNYSATRAERIPALVGFANYGTTGPCIGNSIPTWAAGVTLRIPIFDGGAMDARRGEDAIRVRQEQTRLYDLREQVALEVRLALSALRLAGDQLAVAEQGRVLADRELEQAERRYRAGVAIGLEVTEAQTHLAEADESWISALFRYNASRIQLSDSMGTLISDLNP